MTTFRQLLDLFEDSAKTRAAKGRRFEVFCESYFRVDPLWAERFDHVWSWSDWPGRDGRSDTGVDLVAREAGTGNLVAIQCKFYSPDATLDWRHVSTFVGMLGQPDFASGMLVSTAGSESGNVHSNLARNAKDVVIWRVDDFEDSRVDWDHFHIDEPNQLNLRDPKRLRSHQEKAIADVEEGLLVHKRGQLLMACGTGKTFTSLRLAESTVGPGGSVLFLVPSINLLSQAVKAWANDATIPLATFAVCSDNKAGQRSRDEDMNANDLAFPASTNPESLLDAMSARTSDKKMTAIFSTYQSIDVIGACQAAGLGEFDLIICDEAHRTTGAFTDADDQSTFTKVHQNNHVASSKRLYMTATPRVYGDQTKARAAEQDVIVASMDDETTFGPVFHELPFGEAVAQELLTDYKVLVLAVNEDAVSGAFQRQLSTGDGELALDDVARIIGCWHGLSKRGPQFDVDNIPMRRAVAFSSTIKQSKAFAKAFPDIVNEALEDRRDSNAVKIETDHVDGTTNVKVRSEAIAWLEEPPGQRVCRVLSNAKCLTEGVDVPALDAVLFLQPRKSIVDVVQAVGRVMRLSEGKEFGYVILPIGVPAGVPPEQALKDNKKYQVVWQVLQALRSHDERLAAEINKIDINKTSSKVEVIGIGINGGDGSDDPGVTTTTELPAAAQLSLPDLEEWRDALYARIVEKVGDRRYMETWAADISSIAAAQETRIRALLDHHEQNSAAAERFDTFLTALRNNLNDSVTRDDAIGMLSQHLITRPVFEALFGGSEFTTQNPVSQVMQAMIDTLDTANLGTETATLEGFYNHIRMLIGGIDTAEGRQRVITELYEKFFKKALPKAAGSLGVVYTPIEIVDFISRAVNQALQRHFNGATISDEGVHILDPFTGTGTFITRLIQTGLITSDALPRKYATELHCNEIILLAYYIAAINIETAFHGRRSSGVDYQPFDGIVLTDTFQMTEEGDSMDHLMFPRNNARADRQKQLDIRVIIGNPPYSVGQGSQNDDNQNRKYPTLDASIERTYQRMSDGNPRSLYDSYIRAIRWATNRLDTSPDGGIIGYVTNGGWLDGNTAAGIRKTLAQEFHHIYIYNLRGNQKGDWRREGGKIFGQGSQVTVAITLLLKQRGPVPDGGAEIHYHDIGDYLSREQKLDKVASANLNTLGWTSITPNEHGDWINHRSSKYDQLVPLHGDPEAIFKSYHRGLETGRDAWVYNSSLEALRTSVRSMSDFFDGQLRSLRDRQPGFQMGSRKQRIERVKKLVDRDPTLFSWTNAAFAQLASEQPMTFDAVSLRSGVYRPFFKQRVAFNKQYIQQTNGLSEYYPNSDSDNLGITVQQSGPAPFSVLATNCVSDLVSCGAGNPMAIFARWRYEPPSDDDTLLDALASGWVSNLNPEATASFRHTFGDDVTEDALFFYVYGILHSPDFRQEFEVNLRKEPPRVPVVETKELFDAFAAAGRELCDLHIGYETVDPYPLAEEWSDGKDPAGNPDLLLVGTKRMRYPKITDADTGKKTDDRTRLIYNPHLTLAGIPSEAHDYTLGTRSGVDWLIDRYHVTTDKASGIINDPNQWGIEHGNPRYIIDLIKRVVAVSMRTAEIVHSLPKLSF